MVEEIKMEDIDNAMKGYDPTKPLHIESPLGMHSNEALEYDENGSDLDQYFLYSGDPIEAKNYKIIFKFPKSERQLKKMNIIPASFSSGIIVDIKVLEILNKHCFGEFQAFPIIIRNKEEKRKVLPFENKDFYLIHIIKKVIAIDLKRSEFLLFEKSKGKVAENIMGPHKLRFLSNCMDNTNIAKDSYLPSVILISQSLAQILHNENIKGAISVPDWLSLYDRIYQKVLRPD
jgi:hypothetical protein